MSWRIVHIRNPARLYLKDRQIMIEQDNGTGSLPLEDVAVLVLETPQASVTSSLLAKAQEEGLTFVTCDERHMPNGVLLPFHQHSRLSEVAQLQINASKPFRKRLWQRIVCQKILNQADCLKQCKRKGATRLQAMIKQVTSGDTNNIEAHAARYYWTCQFGDDFRRHKEDFINHALNYGYAVIRSVISRALVAAGLLPCFGLHHANQLNAFNLADDMLEPLRPFVDRHVSMMAGEGALPPKFTTSHRQELAGLAVVDGRISGEIHNMLNIAEKMAESLVASIRAGDVASLALPELA